MRSILMFFVIVAFFSISTAFAQTSVQNQPKAKTSEQAKTQAKSPELPDFNKKPFFLYVKMTQVKPLFSESRIPNGTLYVNDPEKPTSLVMLFTFEDGSASYAEWIEITDKGTMARSYNLKDGKWVMDKEAPWPLKESQN